MIFFGNTLEGIYAPLHTLFVCEKYPTLERVNNVWMNEALTIVLRPSNFMSKTRKGTFLHD